MVLTYRGIDYTVDDISTSTEIYMTLPNIDAGIKVLMDLRDMQSYVFNDTQKQGMIVSKITLSSVRGGDTRLMIGLRRPVGSEKDGLLEQTQAELAELKSMVAPILQTGRVDSTAVKILQASYPDLVADKEVK